MINKASLLMALGGFALAGNALAADATPEMLANACGGCHGTNGISVGPATPTIAGLAKEYFVSAMEAYKKNEWGSTVMGRIARGYSTEEFTAMADFFAKQKYVYASQKSDAEKAKKGEKLHKEFCEKCHENGAKGDDEFGPLAGQWAPYLKFTMEDYVSGARPMSTKMKSKIDQMLKDHKDDAVDSIVHYYTSMK